MFSWTEVFLDVKSWVSLGIVAALMAIHVTLFFTLPDSEIWITLIVAIFVSLCVYAQWGYAIYRHLYPFRFRPASSPLLPLLDFSLMYLVAVAHNAALFATVAMMQNLAFIGINSDVIERWQVYYLSFFLSTGTLSTLGTGATFPNPLVEESVGYIPVWFESIQAILLFTIVAWGTTNEIRRAGYARNKK
jgi:hypothetical protein